MCIKTARPVARSLGAALIAALAANAWADSASTTLSVSATVSQNCLISASAVAFGAYDPVLAHSAAGAPLNGTGSVSVTCTKSAAGVSITLGLGANAAGSTRRMLGASSGGHLAYELYHPSATTPAAACTFPGTTIWGTSGGGVFTPSGVAGWGAASSKTFHVCGTVPNGQDVAADSYTDSVVATINF